MITTNYYQGVALPSEEDLYFIPQGACKTCGFARCKCTTNASFVLSFYSVGVVLPIIDYSTNNTSPEPYVLSTTDYEANSHEEEEIPSRVVHTTSELWVDESLDAVFMAEVEKWARNKPGDWEEVFGDAMLKYAELRIEYPAESFESEKAAKAFWMQSIKNNRIDIDRKSKSFGKGGAVMMSLDTSEEENEVGYYDTYDFEYDMEFSDAEKKTVEELAAWEETASENNLRKDDLKLYKKVAKLEKKVPEVERKTVVFIESSKAIDLRDDAATQKALSSEVVVRKQNSLEVLISKTRKKSTHTLPLGSDKSRSYVETQGSEEAIVSIVSVVADESIETEEWYVRMQQGLPELEPDW